ncbi:MAG: hypothetical protein II100_01730, partial [Prevotella sp.]|nr:hypothetical protein [Prevotella sp.]
CNGHRFQSHHRSTISLYKHNVLSIVLSACKSTKLFANRPQVYSKKVGCFSFIPNKFMDTTGKRIV